MADIPQGVQLKGMNDFQVAGSAITYFRRYALSSALGLVTDKDTDASGEKKETKQPIKQPLTITDEAFEKATEAIRNGSVTVAQVKAKYVLSTVQEKALELIEGLK
jgi:hypothetical protein